MTETLRGREIILAGGAGGLGTATAALLSQEGASLILSYRANHERAERSGHRIVQADLASENDRAALLDSASEPANALTRLWGRLLTCEPNGVRVSRRSRPSWLDSFSSPTENNAMASGVRNPGVTEAGMAKASVASGKYERYLQEGAIPRYGKAEDVARAIRFLLEPDNYVTGQVLTVDGGLTL